MSDLLKNQKALKTLFELSDKDKETFKIDLTEGGSDFMEKMSKRKIYRATWDWSVAFHFNDY